MDTLIQQAICGWSIHLTYYTSTHPSIHSSIPPFMHLPSTFHPSVYPSIHPSTCPPVIYPFIRPSIHLSPIPPSTFPSFLPSIHLSSTHLSAVTYPPIHPFTYLPSPHRIHSAPITVLSLGQSQNSQIHSLVTALEDRHGSRGKHVKHVQEHPDIVMVIGQCTVMVSSHLGLLIEPSQTSLGLKFVFRI